MASHTRAKSRVRAGELIAKAGTDTSGVERCDDTDGAADVNGELSLLVLALALALLVLLALPLSSPFARRAAADGLRCLWGRPEADDDDGGGDDEDAPCG